MRFLIQYLITLNRNCGANAQTLADRIHMCIRDKLICFPHVQVELQQQYDHTS